MKEENPLKISTRDQLWILTAAIILGGMASNYSTVSTSTIHIIVAKCAAKELIDRILND